jgi:hypothetical protein
MGVLQVCLFTMKILARDKRSSLLILFVNDKENSFKTWIQALGVRLSQAGDFRTLRDQG